MISVTCLGRFLLSYKFDAFSTFIEWKTGIENWTGKRVKTLRTDNGTEYCEL